ncbi:MAG: 50S ribosomal protein L20 [Elusimicrobia bacterium GWA2_61_42]|nr:MAG: 50S ribosomal protein L20 [Elusimicrobia bacterium GWA2_61_42]OGR75251.1 MAG: 50S ribosomal protein L20 [Elusimicrobia bacterium GWC2_61_25]
MRIKYSVPRTKRKKKVLKLAKGYYGNKGNRLRQAIQQVNKSLTTAYIHRRDKKGDIRQLWIVRLNAAAREEGMSYSRFMDGIHKANINLNRKMLSEIAIRDPQSFKQLAEIARKAIGTIKKVVGTEK